MNNQPKTEELEHFESPGTERAQWQSPQMHRLDAREAEIGPPPIIDGVVFS